eukprot:2682583-Prymnesium_polylepis.1
MTAALRAQHTGDVGRAQRRGHRRCAPCHLPQRAKRRLVHCRQRLVPLPRQVRDPHVWRQAAQGLQVDQCARPDEPIRFSLRCVVALAHERGAGRHAGRGAGASRVESERHGGAGCLRLRSGSGRGGHSRRSQQARWDAQWYDDHRSVDAVTQSALRGGRDARGAAG